MTFKLLNDGTNPARPGVVVLDTATGEQIPAPRDGEEPHYRWRHFLDWLAAGGVVARADD